VYDKMELGGSLGDLAFIVLTALAVGGIALAVLFPMFGGSQMESRVGQISADKKENRAGGLRARFSEDVKDVRRRQIQEALNQIGDEQKKKQKVTLRALIAQAGLDISVRSFWLASVASGIVIGIASMAFGLPWFMAAAAGFAGFLGLPRWVLGFLKERRKNVFLNDFADAIDVMVRGLKAGLPVSEAIKIIASESSPPVGPEFQEVAEGQRIGISIDQGIERMAERMPLAEVNFLAIVMAIQAKTGGNLSEALSNLSRVLRDRKKMKQKIKAVSQEAKSSAMIIGALPFCIAGILSVASPNYLDPMFDTEMGNMMLVGCAICMSIGILIMRQMINFEI
jgi:tight adherence protein B